MQNAALKESGIEMQARFFRLRLTVGGGHPTLRLGFAGLNLTVPHKVAALSFVDEVEERGKIDAITDRLSRRQSLGWNTEVPVSSMPFAPNSRSTCGICACFCSEPAGERAAPSLINVPSRIVSVSCWWIAPSTRPRRWNANWPTPFVDRACLVPKRAWRRFAGKSEIGDTATRPTMGIDAPCLKQSDPSPLSRAPNRAASDDL
jgi:hypothetical protein